MPDPKGVIEIEALGRTWRLLFNNRAYRTMEKELGYELAKVREGVHEVTVLLWGGLLAHHPDATLQTADEIIDELGYETIAGVISEALQQSPPLARKTSTS